MTKLKLCRRVALTLFLGVLLFSCDSGTSPEVSDRSNYLKVGSFAATYDANDGQVKYQKVISGPGEFLAPNFALSPDESAGAVDCAIIDSSVTPGDQGYCMGLINPESCVADYNSTTRVLSFYSKIVNRSNLPNSAPYSYSDIVTYPPNSTFYGPFVFIITGITPTSGNSGLVTNVNTNLASGDCGANGLNLLNGSGNPDPTDDPAGNGTFDCIYPDKTYDSTFEGYPGWDFSPYVSNNRMLPGDDTGCVQFMQFTVSANESFTLWFDMLALIDDGLLPTKPTVTSHTNNQYVNADPITVSGASCTYDANPALNGVVHVDGGSSEVTTNCLPDNTYSVSVPLNDNTTNQLNVYQIYSGKQSAATTLTIHHDNIVPTVSSFNPANNETSVSLNTNCLITFSEAMKTSTFTTSNLKITRVSTSSDIGITVSASSDSTQALLIPSSKPLVASNQYDCKVFTGVTDLAGNSIAANTTARFTTAPSGGIYSDVTAPKVVSMYPFDNVRNVSLNTTFTIQFNEPINPATINGNVVDSTCNITGGSIPNVFVFELSQSCNANLPAKIVAGSTTLSADGLQATFTPSGLDDANNDPLEANNCYGFVITSCVKDINGNRLATRGERGITAYSNDDIQYNSYNVFFTGSGDSTQPSIVQVGPILAATDTSERVYPHFVFSEPIDPATVFSDYFYMTILNQPEHLALKLIQDPTLQMVTFAPTSALSTSTSYVSTATGAVTDFAANQMQSPQTSNFTVRAVADTTAPTIIQVATTNGTTIPSSGVVTVSDECPIIDIYFSEPMDPATITGSTVYLYSVAAAAVKPSTIELDDDGMHVRMIADSSLESTNASDNYRVTITTGVKDRAGRALAANNVHEFDVNADGTAPSVTAIVPPNGGTINRNGSILVFFSEEMDKSTLTSSSISPASVPQNIFLSTGCSTSNAPIVFADPNGRWIVANCINNISVTGSNITVTVDRDVRDFNNTTTSSSCEIGSNSNRMAADFTSVFQAVNSDDTTGPTISNLSDISPQDGSTSVSTTVIPTITFNEAIDPRTLMPSSVYIMDQKGNRVSAKLSLSTNARTVTITPLSALTNPEFYYIIATTAIRDLNGGNAYDGLGGEAVAKPGVLRSCFSTSSTACP